MRKCMCREFTRESFDIVDDHVVITSLSGTRSLLCVWISREKKNSAA